MFLKGTQENAIIPRRATFILTIIWFLRFISQGLKYMFREQQVLLSIKFYVS